MDLQIAAPARRALIACEPCRRGKRKCDGLKPSCSECQNHRRKCIFSDRIQKRRKVWDENYVLGLEDQVRSLSTLAKGLKAGLERQHIDRQEHGDHDLQEEYIGPSLPVNSYQTEAFADLGAMLWKLAIDDDDVPSLIGPASALAFYNSLPTSMASNQALQLLSSADMHACNLFTMDRGLIIHFVDCFFKYINPYYHFTDFKNFFGLPDRVNVPLDYELYFCALLSAGACYSERLGAKKVGADLAFRAEQLVMPCYRMRPTSQLAKGLTILGWRELSIGNNNTGWMHITLAAGLIVRLGLHITQAEALVADSLPPQYTQSAQIQSFWSFYFVDRLAIAILGRSARPASRHMELSPFESAFPTMSLSEDQITFSRLCLLWCIHDRYIEELCSHHLGHTQDHNNDILMRARRTLLDFYNDNYSSLKFDASFNVSPTTLIFQMSYTVCQILIHRPFLNDSSESIYKLAFRATSTACSNMSRLICSYRKISSFGMAPPFVVYHILRAALGNLLIVSSKETTLRKRIFPPLKICTDALEEMSSTWPVRVAEALNLIRQLAARWRVTWALPLHLSQPV